MAKSMMETLIRLQNLPFCALCVWNCSSVSVCVYMESRRGGGGSGMRMGSSWRWQLTRAIRVALRWCRVCCPRRASKGGGFVKRWSYCKLLLKSLYFNSQNNSDTLLDCVFEPVYWIVDNVTCWFGVVSCRCFISLSSRSLSSSSHTCHPPVGVCLPGHTAHHLSCAYRLPVHLTCDLQ